MKRDGLDISVLNATRLNSMLLNYSKLNTSTGDRVTGGLTPSPGIKGLVASYRCYDKTNDDEDRNVLKDLSGNGHDIQLYNFAFSGESGYGKYAVNYKTDYYIQSPRAKIDVTYSSIHIHKVLSENMNFIEKFSGDIPAYIIKVTGLQEGQKVTYRNQGDAIRFEISSDGE